MVHQIATKEIFKKGKGKKEEKNDFEQTKLIFLMASVDFPSPVAARTMFNSGATGAPSPNSDPPGRRGLSEEGVRLLLSRGTVTRVDVRTIHTYDVWFQDDGTQDDVMEPHQPTAPAGGDTEVSSYNSHHQPAEHLKRNDNRVENEGIMEEEPSFQPTLPSPVPSISLKHPTEEDDLSNTSSLGSGSHTRDSYQER